MSDLQGVSHALGDCYRAWKASEQAKDQAKRNFFEAVDAELAEEVPQQVIEQIEASDEEEALRIAQRRFPRFRTVGTQQDGDKWNVILEEDPSLKDFAYVNKSDGNVYQRIIAEGSPILDDAGLAEEKPELWEAITEEKTTRELKPLEDLTPEQVAALQPYITMPKPQVRLGAPRKAKEEELEDGPHND